MIILLFITIPISLILQIFGMLRFIASIDDLSIIILASWILYYTKKGKNSRNNKIGTFVVVSMLFGIELRAVSITDKSDSGGLFILFGFSIRYIFYLKIVVAIASFRCKNYKSCT